MNFVISWKCSFSIANISLCIFDMKLIYFVLLCIGISIDTDHGTVTEKCHRFGWQRCNNRMPCRRSTTTECHMDV